MEKNSPKEKCLVLGGEGMLGHMLVSYLKTVPEFDVYFTSRNMKKGIFFDVVKNIDSLDAVIDEIKPNLVINCIGIINSLVETNNKDIVTWVNSYFPRKLAKICKAKGIKLIHISTDCVFSGKEGNYNEESEYSPVDFYGVSKAAGEIIDDHNLTIRTSIIGPEIKEPKNGLMEWFFSQKEKEVKGFKKVIWSGVTTLELAKKIVEFYKKDVKGLIVVASKPINKYDLLCLIKEIYSLEIIVHPVESPVCDRSMRSVREDIRYSVPNHKEMLEDLKKMMDKEENVQR